jgi:branched-chain amino acid transport system substrate-binding protein
MSTRIGILLPRSIEYPAIGFDLLDGLRIHLRQLGLNDITFHTENIGFGEDQEVNHAAAEKLVLNNDVDMLIIYATSLNAENLYSFASSSSKPILFLDAGMEHFEAPLHSQCYHLTLQGTQACSLQGKMAAGESKKIAFAASFLDGGYRGVWFTHEAIAKEGSEISGNYVSVYKPEEFSLAQLETIIQNTETGAVAASFTSYLAELFFTHLKNASEKLKNISFYCSPFMAEETVLDNSPFPHATFHAIVPWSRTIESIENQIFIDSIKKEKNKIANIFHLLGWEAALVVQHIINEGISSLSNSSFNTPRGIVRFHPDTNSAYAPLYKGRIVADEKNNCKLLLSSSVEITPEMHFANHFARPVGEYTRWKNNFFCI